MKLSFDTNRTIAILIGVSQYDSDFTSIPPIDNNLTRLKQIFTDENIIGLIPENIVVIHNKNNIAILRELKNALNKDSIDTLIIYYAGHGYRISKDKLYLTAANSISDIDLITTSGLDFTQFKTIIEKCPAYNRILFIDACYSGIATQSSKSSFSIEQDIKGTYIITSSPHDEESLFDPKSKFTFFTGELIKVLSEGEATDTKIFTIGDIYDKIRKGLTNDGLPEPKRRDNLNIGKFYFAKNMRFNRNYLLRRAQINYLNSDFEEALSIYKQIQLLFPDESVNILIEKCSIGMNSLALEKEADELFQIEEYEKSLEIYRKIYEVTNSISINVKIDKCYVQLKSVEKTQKEKRENRLFEEDNKENKSQFEDNKNRVDKNLLRAYKNEKLTEDININQKSEKNNDIKIRNRPVNAKKNYVIRYIKWFLLFVLLIFVLYIFAIAYVVSTEPNPDRQEPYFEEDTTSILQNSDSSNSTSSENKEQGSRNRDNKKNGLKSLSDVKQESTNISPKPIDPPKTTVFSREKNTTKQIHNNKDITSFFDARDGNSYRTLLIGDQLWMIDNLRYNAGRNCSCYNNLKSNCDKYGRLYDFYTAKISCPEGWHLPSNKEWNSLLKNISDRSEWSDNSRALKKDSKFSPLLGGEFGHNLFNSKGDYWNENQGYYWTATESYEGNQAWHYSFDSDGSILHNSSYINDRLSCRCLKD